MGLELSRTTMANWVIQASRTWLKPLIEHMHDELLKEHYIHGDETRVQVLKEPEKKATPQSYMWVYSNISGSPHPITLFDYRPNRSSDNPKEYLKGFSGYLITDAYAGYNHLEGVTNVYCWAHARRKFVEALPKDRKGIEDSLSCRAIEKIGKLFAIKKKIADMDCEEKKRIRQNEAVPLLKDFFTWCFENRDKTLKRSKVNKAFSYALDHQEGLCRYIEDGHLPMTNSLDERVIRPFTTGRKNWLFSDSVKGAESSGYVYSIIETAKANQIDPYKYLCFVFKNMPGSDYIRNREVIENLMPWSRQAQEICK